MHRLTKSLLIFALVANCLLPAAPPARPGTFANPINIDYRFMITPPSRREAADPANRAVRRCVLPVRVENRAAIGIPAT
jgi:hypothetical protein